MPRQGAEVVTLQAPGLWWLISALWESRARGVSVQDSSPSDNPDTKEGKEHSSLLCQKCLSTAEFLSDWEGETAGTDISLNYQISCCGGLRYCHLKPLWDFNTWGFNTWWPRTESGLCRVRAAKHRVLPAAPCALLTSLLQALEHHRGDAFSCSS